jgi:hypothetical protein
LISWRGGTNKLSKRTTRDEKRERADRTMLASKQGKIAIGTEQEERGGDFSLEADNGECRNVGAK